MDRRRLHRPREPADVASDDRSKTLTTAMAATCLDTVSADPQPYSRAFQWLSDVSGHPPQTSTAGSGFPQVDLPPERLPELLHGAKNVWVFYSPYAREPARYREAMRRTHDEVAYTKLHGLAFGCYRSR